MTLTDLLRDGVKQAIANGDDLTQPRNRTIFLKKFIEDHKDDEQVSDNIKTLRPTADKVFRDELGESNIEKSKTGHKKTKYNSKLASEIAARTTEKKSGIRDTKDEKDTKDKKDSKDKKDGKDTTKKLEAKPVLYDHWDAMGIGALFQAMLMPLRAAWPEMEGLNDEEKQALGEMFLPGFQRYGDEKLQYLILPMMGAVGILAPKVIKGRKLHKEAGEKKKQKKLDNKLSVEEEARINKLTCTFCNEMFDSAHIKNHQETCKKRIKTQRI